MPLCCPYWWLQKLLLLRTMRLAFCKFYQYHVPNMWLSRSILHSKRISCFRFSSSLFPFALLNWSIGYQWNALFHFSFSILIQSVGLHRRGICPSQGRYHTQTQNKCRETSIPWVGFEPTIPVFERVTTVHALDRGHCVGRFSSC
jgi:hypothetical protein